MKNDTDFRTRFVQVLGTTMILAWVVILGPLGALLLGGAAYTMLTDTPTSGVVCGIVFFFPFLCTWIWGLLKILELRRERIERRASVLAEIEPIGTVMR